MRATALATASTIVSGSTIAERASCAVTTAINASEAAEVVEELLAREPARA
jgi:hypothetical protein